MVQSIRYSRHVALPPTEAGMPQKANNNNAQEGNPKPDWAVTAEAAGYTPKKTIGEKIFDSIAYIGIGDVLVFIASIGLAYGLKYSSAKIPGTNTSWAQGWENVGAKLTDTLGLKTKEGKRVNNTVENVLMSTVLMMPGNFAVFPIRWMEKRKTEIVKKYNEKHGKSGKEGIPSDVEQGEWNTKSEAMQSWGTLWSGRGLAWLAVFTSLTALDKVRPTALPNFTEKTGLWFERTAAKMGLAEKPEADASRATDRTGKKGNKRAYYLGELSAIDFFADIAAIAILYVMSKFFAKRRDQKKEAEAGKKAPQIQAKTSQQTPDTPEITPQTQTTVETAQTQEEVPEAVVSDKRHADSIAPRDEVEPRAASHAQARKQEVESKEVAESAMAAGA